MIEFMDQFRIVAGQGFTFISNNLITILPGILVIALIVRYVAYKSGKSNHSYFTTFSRSGEKLLNKEDKYDKVEDVETWLNSFLDKIVKELPDRSLRDSPVNIKGSPSGKSSTFRHRDKESLKEFADGKRSIINAVKQQLDAFKSPHPPNFSELTRRVLDQDKQWNFLLGTIPMSTLSRMLDVLPGLFVIGGIFGTFIGITSALPIIGQIDLAELDTAGEKLTSFVTFVAYSMNTSIAGIVCSVIMMILNAIFPLETTRRDVKKSLERTFEFIWYRIHGNQLSQGEHKIVQALDRIQIKLGGSRNKLNNKKRLRRAA